VNELQQRARLIVTNVVQYVTRILALCPSRKNVVQYTVQTASVIYIHTHAHNSAIPVNTMVFPCIRILLVELPFLIQHFALERGI
jgi:hypothetical protein